LVYAVNAPTGLVIGFLAIVGMGLIYRNQMAQARAHGGVDSVRVGRAMAYLGWHGTLHQFEVRSPQFARDFYGRESKHTSESVNGSQEFVGWGWCDR